jgi:para-nitrobenzyl esterase
MQKIKLTGSILVICLVLIGFSFLAGCTQKEQPATGVVKIDSGNISGTSENGLQVYRGIPFAAPPVGDLRWKPPATVQPWDGVREAKNFSADPPQPGTSAPIPGVTSVNTSEDCLYLNVWTPANSSAEKLPVMVFFYGGAFGQVAGSTPAYNGTALAKQGVVVVTTNYRIGALGFLAHPQLDNESPNNTSGNYGLLDQIAALQWVQRNIKAFGGDPSQVTIFGQSAGAESVLIHLVSPLSKGLFQQVIVESGTFWENGAIIDAEYSKADAEKLGEQYAQGLGYTGPDAITQMRKLSAQDLINATNWPASSFQIVNTPHFEPTIDGWVLPDSLDNLFGLHRQSPVPLIIGTNADDGVTLSANANMTVPEYQTFIQNRFGNDTAAVLAKYPANSTQEVQFQLSRIMTDYDFSDAAKFAAGSMADLNQSAYLYRYSYALPGQSLGAFHGSETLLLFRVLPKLDPVTTAVADNLVDLWTRFAKTGDPNGGMNVTWPKYTNQTGQYLDIGNVSTVKSGY